MREQKLINAVFVVEGKSDADKLIKAGVPYVVITEGTKVPRETIEHLQMLKKFHKIIVLSDPDKPGDYIFNKISVTMGDIIRLNVNKRDTIKNQSVGIENMNIETLKSYIDPYLKNEFITQSDVTFMALLNCGLTGPNSKARKLRLCQKYNLLYRGNKNLLLQMKMLNITLDDIESADYE